MEQNNSSEMAQEAVQDVSSTAEPLSGENTQDTHNDEDHAMDIDSKQPESSQTEEQGDQEEKSEKSSPRAMSSSLSNSSNSNLHNT